jgi:hypothetical protein
MDLPISQSGQNHSSFVGLGEVLHSLIEWVESVAVSRLRVETKICFVSISIAVFTYGMNNLALI